MAASSLYRGFAPQQSSRLDRSSKPIVPCAGYDNFHALDGKFLDPLNVILQIKHGPIDFQVREPVSPLFRRRRPIPTRPIRELQQITQEYTGQQRHPVYSRPHVEGKALDTDMRASALAPPLPGIKEIVSGSQRSAGTSHHRRLPVQHSERLAPMARPGHSLALANLYGFGRIAWDANLSAAAISDEWTRLSFGNDPQVRAVVNKLELDFVAHL